MLDLAPGDRITHGDDLTVSGEVFSPDGRAPAVMIGIVRADGTPVYGVSTDMDEVGLRQVDAKRYRYELTFLQLALLPGQLPGLLGLFLAGQRRRSVPGLLGLIPPGGRRSRCRDR